MFQPTFIPRGADAQGIAGKNRMDALHKEFCVRTLTKACGRNRLILRITVPQTWAVTDNMASLPNPIGQLLPKLDLKDARSSEKITPTGWNTGTPRNRTIEPNRYQKQTQNQNKTL